MKTYITTIEELTGKTRRELNAIFKKAADIAAETASQASERGAAKRTLHDVRRCLNRLDGP